MLVCMFLFIRLYCACLLEPKCRYRSYYFYMYYIILSKENDKNGRILFTPKMFILMIPVDLKSLQIANAMYAYILYNYVDYLDY